MLGYLDFYDDYTMLTNRAAAVFLALTVASWAALGVFGLTRVLQGDREPADAVAANGLEGDPQLPAALILAAAFSVLAWVGGSLGFGVIRSFLGVLQRAFMMVPLIAGIYCLVSPLATISWCAAILINLSIGIMTGSRTAAFMPLAFFAMGLVLGAGKRVRLKMILAVAVAAIPLGYVFGIMEVVRGEVGYFRAGDVSLESIAQVGHALKEKRPASANEYEDLPAWVRTSWRLVTWPTYVVAVSAAPPYRGFDDLGAQIGAAANIVTISREAGDNYAEEVGTSRATAYGFLVNEGTSVEFGLVPESWDRGGPLASFGYCIVAVLILAGLEAGMRKLLVNRPAFCAVAISVVCTTAFWGLNIYNLPSSLRQLMVNLLFCGFLFALFAMLIPSDPNSMTGPARALGQRQRPSPKLRRRN
jgi:hypothetical protein